MICIIVELPEEGFILYIRGAPSMDFYCLEQPQTSVQQYQALLGYAPLQPF